MLNCTDDVKIVTKKCYYVNYEILNEDSKRKRLSLSL
jgi:hypothetical protein